LLVVNLLAFVSLVTGLVIFISGRNFNNPTVGLVGAYLLLLGGFLVGARIFYWILQKIIGQGLESMAKEQLISQFRQVETT
jgi:hypothetical protein